MLSKKKAEHSAGITYIIFLNSVAFLEAYHEVIGVANIKKLKVEKKNPGDTNISSDYYPYILSNNTRLTKQLIKN